MKHLREERRKVRTDGKLISNEKINIPVKKKVVKPVKEKAVINKKITTSRKRKA